MLTDTLWLLLGTVFVNNFVLVHFLGLCPFVGVSSRIEHALGLGLATTLVLTLAALISHLLETYLLRPFDAMALRTLSFILVIAVLVQFTELWMRHVSEVLHRVLGLYLPLITTNCAVLGVALLNSRESHNLLQSAVYGLGAALGFTLVLVLFAGLRERCAHDFVPDSLRGLPLALLSAGIMSMAFMGFAGMGSQT